MRFILLIIMSIQGDVETVQVNFPDNALCQRAKREIETALTTSPEVKLQSAHCLEVSY